MDIYSYGRTLGLDKWIELVFPYIYIWGYSYGELGSIVTVVGDSINYDVGSCFSGGLGTILD